MTIAGRVGDSHVFWMKMQGCDEVQNLLWVEIEGT